MKNKELKKRILELSYKHKLSHLGSCLTSVDIINDIYSNKKNDEKFILSNGHAGLALYVVLESLNPEDKNLAEVCLLGMGIHPTRAVHAKGDLSYNFYTPKGDKNVLIGTSPYIDCSTGSLGQGLPIALGMALADRSKNVYCMISDGECAEGSIWESFRIAYEQHLTNLHIYVSINGWGAYRPIDVDNLIQDLNVWVGRGLDIHICETGDTMKPFEVIEGLRGQSAHYYVLKDQDYTKLMGVM